ncbi:3393_t:CDS:1, partial [Ambispora leptoticha]
QESIKHVWSIFSAAPAQNQRLILQGILNACCLSQLSFLSNNLKDLIRIDFLNALPSELSFKILSFLDAKSLYNVAQVSKTWKCLADDDVVWRKMCEQHIDKKCTKCGVGLPLLERKRKTRDKSRDKRLCSKRNSADLLPLHYHSYHNESSFQGHSNKTLSPSSSPSLSLNASPCASIPNSPEYFTHNEKRESKRLRALDPTSVSLFPPLDKPLLGSNQRRPWKDVFSERLAVEQNWRKGLYTCRTLKGHEDYVMCMQLDDNGTLITGSYDATVRIWNIETGEMVRVLKGHRRCVRGLQFDDVKLITCSMDQTLRIWNHHTGKLVRTLEGHTSGVNCLHFDEHILVSGSVDAEIKVWNFQTAECFTLTGHCEMINKVAIYQQTLLFSCSDDMTIRVWNLKTRSCISKLEGHVAQVQCVLPAPPSLFSSLVASTKDTGLKDTGLEECSNHEDDCDSVYSDYHDHSNLPILVSASLDNTIKIWSTRTGRCLRTLFGHVEGIWGLTMDKLRMASVAQDRTVKVWDVDTGKC